MLRPGKDTVLLVTRPIPLSGKRAYLSVVCRIALLTALFERSKRGSLRAVTGVAYAMFCTAVVVPDIDCVSSRDDIGVVAAAINSYGIVIGYTHRYLILSSPRKALSCTQQGAW